MDGLTHYREAESLLQRNSPPDATTIALAQVHATLAAASGYLALALANPALAGRIDPGGVS